MLRQAFLATLLLTTALAGAGCLTPPLDEVQAVSAEDAANPISASASAPPVAPYYILDAEASPGATLTSFWWTVPQGAVYKEKIWNRYDTTVLEVALLDEEGNEPALTEWALFAFRESGKGLAPAMAYFATPIEGEAESLLPILVVRAEGSDVETAPIHYTLGYENFEEGDRVAFVLAARSESPMPIRLAFRVLPEALEWPRGDEPAKSAAAFLQGVAGLTPTRLETAGSGDGLQLALRFEYSVGVPWAFEVRFWTPNVVYERDMVIDEAPLASSGVRRLSASFDGGGWGSASGFYWGDVSVGSWRGEYDVHGAADRGEGTIVQAPLVSLASLVVGFPYYYVVAEGEGPSAATFEVDTTAVNANGVEFLVFDQVDLGATMGDLFAKKAEKTEYIFSGLAPLPSATYLRSASGDLARVAPGGFSATWQGVAFPDL